jgi:hypothetical protein
MTARHLYRTILMLLVTLILIWGYTFLVDQAPFGAQPVPSLCRLAVAYLSLPARRHDRRRPVAPTTQLVAGLERIVGRCVVHNLIPLDRDHFISADRLSGLGVTRVLRVPEVNRESVSAGVQALLTDPAYRQRATAIRVDIAAMPSPGEVARMLVERVSEWSATLAPEKAGEIRQTFAE